MVWLRQLFFAHSLTNELKFPKEKKSKLMLTDFYEKKNGVTFVQ